MEVMRVMKAIHVRQVMRTGTLLFAYITYITSITCITASARVT